MINLRPTHERGYTQSDWLKSFHTFSFDQYKNPDYTHFGCLRVINEDYIAPNKGFGMHGHQDMEIITYILSGKLQHQDNLNNKLIISQNEVQRMSAGTGIRHSEYNLSNSDEVHLVQIWIIPSQKGLPPEYEQKIFNESDKQKKWCLIASPLGQDNSVRINQSVFLYVAALESTESLSYDFLPDCLGWIQVTKGTIELNGTNMAQGDGAALIQENKIVVTATAQNAEVLLFDMQNS